MKIKSNQKLVSPEEVGGDLMLRLNNFQRKFFLFLLQNKKKILKEYYFYMKIILTLSGLVIQKKNYDGLIIVY